MELKPQEGKKPNHQAMAKEREVAVKEKAVDHTKVDMQRNKKPR